MSLLNRIREVEIVRTNTLGRERSFFVGAVVNQDGKQYRVTRHKEYATEPWSTVVVYGVPVGGKANP